MTTLVDALSRLNVPDLKPLVAWLPGASVSGRKADLIDAIVRGLSPSGLLLQWSGLDELQRLAVAEALYARDGVFDAERFRAKHGRLPSFSTGANRRLDDSSPTRLALFVMKSDRCQCVPIDLRPALQAFVPVPEPARLATVEVLPASLDEAVLSLRLTEGEAFVDLTLMLRLVEQGKLQVSDKTSLPTAGTLRMLSDKLAGGDFYADEAPKNAWGQRIGPIKAFAWPMLMLAAGLAQRTGSKLALSKRGLKAFAITPEDVLRAVWQRWLDSDLLDEFNRIEVIKGQGAKGRVMTDVPSRREEICGALKLCPSGEWIAAEEFSRFMRASGHAFEVTCDPWKLYISEAKYGSLGYSNANDWMVLQHRYLLCVLFEYAATLGMIDVACVQPDQAKRNFSDLWGTDELDFLSRYDGLAFFRITALGAYCLGTSERYANASPPGRIRLSVLPSLQIQVTDGEPSVEETMTLEAWCLPETPRSWRLDPQQAMSAIERGHKLDDLLLFLQSRDEQPLPQTVESFIATCRKNATALKVVGTAVLIECQDAATAELLAGHKLTKGLCLRAGELRLVVRLENEGKFRALVRVLGLGMSA